VHRIPTSGMSISAACHIARDADSGRSSAGFAARRSSFHPSWRTVIYWCSGAATVHRWWRHVIGHQRRIGCSGCQLVIMCGAVDVVVDDGQLLTSAELLIAGVTCETVHVKDEVFDSHHQLTGRHLQLAFRTAWRRRRLQKTSMFTHASHNQTLT